MEQKKNKIRDSVVIMYLPFTFMIEDNKKEMSETEKLYRVKGFIQMTTKDTSLTFCSSFACTKEAFWKMFIKINYWIRKCEWTTIGFGVGGYCTSINFSLFFFGWNNGACWRRECRMSVGGGFNDFVLKFARWKIYK